MSSIEFSERFDKPLTEIMPIVALRAISIEHPLAYMIHSLLFYVHCM